MKRVTLFSLLFLLFTFGSFAQSDLQQVAVVNLIRSEPITVRQLRTEVEKLEKASGRVLNQDQRKQVLNSMIDQRLMLQAAERDKVTVTDNELNQQIQQLRSGMAEQIGRQPTEAEFAAAIKDQFGLEMPAFRDQLKKQLTMQKYLVAKKPIVNEKVSPPSDAEVLSQYNLAKSQLVRPDTVRLSMITVPYGPDAASKTKAKQLADRLVRDIGTNSTKFDEAVLRAQAPNSGYQARDGNYLPRNIEAARIMGESFINTAFGLRQGQVSGLLEGQAGYQIIKITATYNQKTLELDDVFQLETGVTVRQYITAGLTMEKQQAAVVKATEELVAELRRGRSFEIFEANIKW